MVNQPRYANDAAGGRKFTAIKVFFRQLYEEGAKFGYFLELTKSILTMMDVNSASPAAVCPDEGFKIRWGHCYLGGFIGKEPAQAVWVIEKVARW